MISIKDIEKLAELARIHLAEAEKASLSKEIDSILSYVAQIQTASAAAPADSAFLRNVMREDLTPHQSGVFSEVLLGAAPHREGDYFKVKKILN